MICSLKFLSQALNLSQLLLRLWRAKPYRLDRDLFQRNRDHEYYFLFVAEVTWIYVATKIISILGYSCYLQNFKLSECFCLDVGINLE